MIIVNGLTIITKCSILDFAAALSASGVAIDWFTKTKMIVSTEKF